MRRVAFWLSLILVFAIPWENVIFIEGIGATGARAVGLLVAAYWILTVVITGEFRKPSWFHIAVYIFVLWNVASAIWSVNVNLTIPRLRTLLQLLAMVFIIWDLYSTPRALQAGLQAYVLGAYVAITSTIVNYASGIDSGSYRYAASGFNVNDLGLTLALGIPVAWHLALTERIGFGSNVLRLVNFAYIPFATLAIMLTASRGSLIAAVPAFLFVIGSLTRFKPSSRVLIFVAIVFVLFALQPLIPQSSLQRFATISSSIAGLDFGGRVDIWRQSIEVFSEHPLLGVGSGAFSAAVRSGATAHNSFLSVLVEVGMIGLLMFVFVLVMTAYQALRQPKWAARLWLTILLVWSIGSISTGWEDRKPTWLFLSLIIVSAGLSVRRNELLAPTVQHRTQFPLQSREKTLPGRVG